MAVRKVYRSVVGVRRSPSGGVPGTWRPRGCDHTSRYHSTPEAAHTCMAARVKAALSTGPVLELEAKIEYSHSRHDWFPA